MFSFDSELVIWDDRQIEPTTAWFEKIQGIMERAKVAICLISPDYLASSFCRNEEVPYLLKRHARGDMVLVFVLVRPCAWHRLPWLAALQIMPRDNKAISSHFGEDWDTPFTLIADYIYEKALFKADPTNMDIDKLLSDTTAFPELAANFVDLTRLPTSGFDVVGRDVELQFLNEAFDGDTLNVVSLRAWGGVGKSTLVNKWCEYLAADNYRGARRTFAWSFYSQGTNERVTSADAFIDEALRFFGDAEPEAGSPWSKGERLAALVGKEKALLILDGMEPLQDEHQGIKDPALARLVECLAEENAGLCVITTRKPVKEFADFPETTEEVDLEQLSKEAGRALLRIKGLRAADGLLEQASEAFGNHALALNLLASYLKRFAGGDVSQALTIPDLPDVSVDTGKHPRRVMAAFAEQFGEGPELDLLHIVGLFDRPADGGCIVSLREEPAISGLTERLSVLGEIGWRDQLEKLRSFGLLAEPTHHDSNKLDAHPLVREHFGAQLRKGQPEAWRAGHLRLYEHLRNEPVDYLPDKLLDLEPLFEAVYHGCIAEQYFDAMGYVYLPRIRRDQNFHHKRFGAYGADLATISNFFDDCWTRPTARLDTQWQRIFLSQAGLCLKALGKLSDAEGPMLEAFRLASKEVNNEEATRSTINLAELYLVLGNVSEAMKFGKLSVEYGDKGNDKFAGIVCLTSLGDIYHQAGKLSEAKDLFDQAERKQIAYKADISHLYSIRAFHYCDLLMDLGNFKMCLDIGNYCLKKGIEQQNDLDAAFGHLILGKMNGILEFGDARDEFEKSIAKLRASQAIDHLPRGLLARAAFFREVEEYEESRRDLAEAMRIAKRYSMRLFECDAHLEYARLALAEGKADAALPHFHSADALVTECGYNRRDLEILDLKEKLGL